MDCFLGPLFLRFKQRVRGEPYHCQAEAGVHNTWNHGGSRRLKTLIERECQGERPGHSTKAKMLIHATDKSRSKFYVQETMSTPCMMSSDDRHATAWTISGFVRKSDCSDDIPSSAATFVDKEELACTTRSVGKTLSNSEDESLCHEQMSTREEKRFMPAFVKESETCNISTQEKELEPSGTRDSDEVRKIENENEFYAAIKCKKINTLSEMLTKENTFKRSTTETDIPKELHDDKLPEETECNTQSVFKMMKASKSVKDSPKVSNSLENLMHHDDEHIYAQIPCRTTTPDFGKAFEAVEGESRCVESKSYRSKLLGTDEEKIKMMASKCLEGKINSPNGKEQLLIPDENEPLYSSKPCRMQAANLLGICSEADHTAPTKVTEGKRCFGFTAKMKTGISLENFLKVQSGVKERVPTDDEPIYSQLPCRQITLTQPLKIPNCGDKLTKCDDDSIYAKVPVPCEPPVSMSLSLSEVPSKALPKAGDWEKSTSITSNILADGEISRRLTRGDIAHIHEEPALPGKNVLGDRKLTFQPKKVQAAAVVVDSAYQKYLQDMMNPL